MFWPFLSVFEGLLGFYAYVNLHIHEENCDVIRGIEFQCCIHCAQNLKIFLYFDIENFHFLWHLIVVYRYGNKLVSNLFSEMFSKGKFRVQNLNMKECKLNSVSLDLHHTNSALTCLEKLGHFSMFKKVHFSIH